LFGIRSYSRVLNAASTACFGGNGMLLCPVGKCITSLCWRPDGKAIAVGLDDGTVSLHDVEVGAGFSFSVTNLFSQLF